MTPLLATIFTSHLNLRLLETPLETNSGYATARLLLRATLRKIFMKTLVAGFRQINALQLKLCCRSNVDTHFLKIFNFWSVLDIHAFDKISDQPETMLCTINQVSDHIKLINIPFFVLKLYLQILLLRFQGGLPNTVGFALRHSFHPFLYILSVNSKADACQLLHQVLFELPTGAVLSTANLLCLHSVCTFSLHPQLLQFGSVPLCR